MKILIVDDDEDSRVFLERALRVHHYSTEGAANGAEALERAYQWHPDLIISDILMPVMNGFELCRRIKTDDRLRNVPFIFYTATFVDQKDEKLAMALGASRFLIKPMDAGDLFRTISEVIDEYEKDNLSVPGQPLGEMGDLCQMQAEALGRKLDQKVQELEMERKALRQSEERFRALTETTSDWIWQVDRDGVYTYSSPKIRDLLGYEPEDIIGKKIFDLISPDDAERLVNEFHAIVESKKPITTLEYVAIHKDGRKVILEKSGVPFFDPSRNLEGYRGIDRDITERKKLEEQFIQAQKMEAIGRLTGGVAHDFNNKLGVIIGHAEMAMIEADPGTPLYRDLEGIVKAANHSADLTRQLLAFARKQTILPKVLDLNDLISGMLKMLRRLIGENIDLAWMPGHELWKVRVDPSQVDQILANLTVNARDAISGVGKISIETENVALDEAYCSNHAGFVPGTYVLLAVSDTGAGMGKEVLDHLFEPFFTTKDMGKGTGLGLSTVYGIVKQNDGFINVYSEPGRGTTFRIYLPQFVSEAGETMVESKEEVVQGGTETVLMVEDDKAMLELGKEILERLGYRVLTANTPEQAIDLVGKHAGGIDLLITDVVMPQMNGRELVAKISALKPALKCLYMSGYTADVIVHHGVLEQGIHFLEKPFSVKNIASKVREALKD